MFYFVRFFMKMCVYFKHFLYLCKRNQNTHLVTFVGGTQEILQVLFSPTSNVTSARREVGCLEPQFC